MRSLLLHYGNGPQKQSFSDTMEADTEFRRAEKDRIRKDAQRFKDYTRNDVAQALAKRGF